MIYTFVISTDPMPYVRMTRKGKFVQPRAQAYMANQEALKLELKNQMQLQNFDMFPAQTPLAVGIKFTVPKDMHTKDLDNLVKAILDAMQGVVFKNDMWIDQIMAKRMKVNPNAPCSTYISVTDEERKYTWGMIKGE